MEYFIDKIKQHPCLWKLNDILYRDIAKKDLVWESIAKECEIVNGKEAKNLWKKLRDSHREALRRRKTSTGQAAQHLRPWKYEAIMEFLLTQKEDNESSSNSNYSNYFLETTIHGTQITSDTNTNNDVNKSPTPPPVSPLSTLCTVEYGKTYTKQLESTENLQRREKNREIRRLERNEARIRNIDSYRSRDALTDLFASLCRKTRGLPKYLQLKVQREIFETITRAEEEALSFEL